ncbi:Actin-related protein 2/3 complex subunit 1B, putative isoform 1 [Hibiscus syriacus]|uniref:Actin-related protein 2/3 complex subunit 1B, putative isoform 1 n=1 Tax=Hibiscus syriacus TaxID=106335 RepID=A0A6A2Y2F7_HIBSY|nr:Actin-related protein 2/3 complex subunit 1B, putative isoform 1 [Hibiscus syriacus]
MGSSTTTRGLKADELLPFTTTLNLLGFSKDLGANVGVFSGLIAENFANTGALVTSVKNFPESRGSMLGLLKGFTGLSGAVMTQIYLAVYGNDSKSLILLIGWLPAAISVVFVYTILTMKPVKHPNEMNVFYQFLGASVVLAVFLMAVTLAEKLVTFSRAAFAGVATVVCFLVFSPLFTCIREELLVWNIQKLLIDPPTEIIVAEPRQLDDEKVPGYLYAASIIIGFSFGAQLPLIFAIISELFGLKYYSTLFNCGQLLSPLGSYIFNVRLTGVLYDREAIKDLAKKGCRL